MQQQHGVSALVWLAARGCRRWARKQVYPFSEHSVLMDGICQENHRRELEDCYITNCLV